jgi:CPSF A subunit region
MIPLFFIPLPSQICSLHDNLTFYSPILLSTLLLFSPLSFCSLNYCSQLVTRGEFIVVGDMMKSISVYVYKPMENVIEEIAKDYNPNWMNTV